MPGSTYYSPQKDGSRKQRYVALRSTRKDGKPTKISRKAALSNIHVDADTLQKMKAKAKAVQAAFQEQYAKDLKRARAAQRGGKLEQSQEPIDDLGGFGDIDDFGGFTDYGLQ